MATFNYGDGSNSVISASNLFKIKYGKLSDNVYNSANVLLGRIKKSYDFTGKRMEVAVPFGFSGGVGSGSLPVANVAKYEDAQIIAKKVYSVCEIDRETIKASMNNEGAFVQGSKEVVQKAVESYMRNASRILFGAGDGVLAIGLGTGANVSGAGTTGSPYLVEIPLAAWKEANWEERDFVQMVTGTTVSSGIVTAGSAEATLLEVVSVNPATRVVGLVGTSVRLAALTGVGPLAATDAIALQQSFLKDPQGLKGVLDASSGTLYGVSVDRRWKAVQEAASGSGLATDLMNKVMLDVQRKCGKVPNLIVTSFTQYRKLLNLLEDQKQYVIEPRSNDLKGKISFKGVEFMSSAGPVGVFAERFCEDDRMYFLNDNYLNCHHRPGFGWFEDDGTVFLRKASSDAYEARYGGYYENYIIPSFHGVLSGLAT